MHRSKDPFLAVKSGYCSSLIAFCLNSHGFMTSLSEPFKIDIKMHVEMNNWNHLCYSSYYDPKVKGKIVPMLNSHLALHSSLYFSSPLCRFTRLLKSTGKCIEEK